MAFEVIVHHDIIRAGELPVQSDSLYSVSYTNRSLDAVLIDLAERMDIAFAYNPALTREKRVTITLNNLTAEQILITIIQQAGLRVQRLETGTYAITRPPPEPRPEPPPPPPAAIEGNVTDALTLQPLAGARIYSAGKAAAVFSDTTGNFMLTGLKSGNHMLTADLREYRITFLTIEVQPGDTAHMHIFMWPDPYLASTDAADIRGPVYRSVISGTFSTGSVIFPEWMRSKHHSWPVTLPGFINIHPLAGYSALSTWSPLAGVPAHGLFLLAGTMPDYSVTGGNLTGGETGTGFPFQPEFSHDNRMKAGGEVSLSTAFLQGGVSSGEREVRYGRIAVDAAVRFLNPAGFDISRLRKDMSSWLYSGQDESRPVMSTVPVTTGFRKNSIDAGLAETGLNIGFRNNNRFRSSLTIHAGKSDVHFLRELYSDLPGNQNGEILNVISEQHDAGYVKASVSSSYQYRPTGRFFQNIRFIRSGFRYLSTVDIPLPDRNGSYDQTEFEIETGYVMNLLSNLEISGSYDFDYGLYDASFNDYMFGSRLRNQTLATHGLNLNVIAGTVAGITVTPHIRFSYNSRADHIGTDPGLYIAYHSHEYPRKGIGIDAEWRQVTRYRHRFRLPVASSSTAIPFYELTMAGRKNDQPASLQYITAGIRFIPDETTALRLFVHHGSFEHQQSPDYFIPGFVSNKEFALNSTPHLTDSKEFRVGGVIYRRFNQPDLEVSLAYSYGESTERSPGRFGGEQVQVFGDVPYHLQAMAQWKLIPEMSVQLFWESRKGSRGRALHEKYYIAGNFIPDDHKLDPYYRLDVGIVLNRKLFGIIDAEAALRLMNILNRRNHMDTVIIADYSVPEPQYFFRKRKLPGFYPEFEVRIGF